MKFNEWFRRFLEEKGLANYTLYEIEVEGTMHFMPNEIVYNVIENLSPQHQEEVKKKIVYIDFKNGDVTDFFKYLAKGIIQESLKAAASA